MIDARLFGERSPRWLLTHLDVDEKPVGPLKAWSNGSIQIRPLSDLGQGGSIEIEVGAQDIDFLRDRLKIVYDPGVKGVEPWGVGVFLMRSNEQVYRDGGSVFLVDLTSKLAVLSEATVPLGFSIPKGANIPDRIAALIRGAGETRIALTPGTAVLPNALTFEENETVLQVVNKLASVANYWAPWVDGEGQIRVEPYQAPQDREATHIFEEGKLAVHRPDWSRDQDLSSVPNLVRVRMPGDDETAGVEGVAVNDDPGSPFSTVSRGRVVSKTYEEEVASKAVADALALRYLLLNQSPVAHLKVVHAILPLEQNMRVGFRSQGYSGEATVRNMGFEMTFDGQCTAEWVEI